MSKVLEKGISVRHLSLTSQCISFLNTELPFLKQQVITAMPTDTFEKGGIDREFETISNDLTEHKKNLLNKISQILMGAIDQSFKEAEKVEWEAERKEPNEYILKLLKNMKSVHKIVSSMLPAD